MQDFRLEHFDKLKSHIRKSPDDFYPDPTTSKAKELEGFICSSFSWPRTHIKAERKAQDMKDRQIKN